jgi:uncharacterized repeat protein (TIGR03803 family)
MRAINTLSGRLGIFALIAFLSLPVLCHAAGQEKQLYSFNCTSGHCGIASSNDANFSGMIFDSAGNLYGASVSELSSGSNCDGDACGYIFELMPTKSGPWKEKTLYNFCSLTNCADGAVPLTGLVFDSVGNLYGTTGYGGTSVPGCSGLGCGTVFELTPGSGGNWTEKVLYNFKGGTDGILPFSTPIFDKTGNLYGTTAGGGSSGFGTVFELIAGSGGKWTEKLLHNFQNNGTDGNDPIGSIAFDKLGRLYGSTASGGKYSGPDCENNDGNTCGAIYLLTPKNGTWTESILHDFQDNGTDAVIPLFGVTLDANGNVYGATEVGGADDVGTVFELTHGTWAEQILISFQAGNGIDPPPGGCFPLGGVTLGKSGTLYGTTDDCGASYQLGGVVFKLSPSGGAWTETVLWDFTNGGGGGAEGLLTLDAAGDLYGLSGGGASNDGFAFEVKP